VGSCADLPLCVRDSAIATGRALARITYGGPAVCGNGVVDLSEACDDGNTDDTDACTSECQPATCGDGFVQAGVEACDDGNQFNDDACTNKCTPPVCGDGIVNGSEECDDGNTDPNDGCVDCRNSITCTGGTIQADIELMEPTSATGEATNIAGVRFEVTYPRSFGIPGSGFETDDSRLAILQSGAAGEGTRLLADRDENGDGTDDTARVVYALIGGVVIGPGPLARLTFDCAAGTPVGLTSLGCTVLEATDSLGTVVTIPTPGMPIPRTITCEVVAIH
jgi:cysteine-rich repeat protein